MSEKSLTNRLDKMEERTCGIEYKLKELDSPLKGKMKSKFIHKLKIQKLWDTIKMTKASSLS